MRLTLRQIENPRPGKEKRTLELDGSLAPVDSLGYGIEQRVEIEWVPGSRVPALQMSGAEYDPTEIRFSWKGRRFTPGEATIDGRDVASIDELVDIVTSLVDDTAIVEVTWRGRSRKAVLQSWKPEEGRLAEAEGVLTVAWVESPSEVLWLPAEVVRRPVSLYEQLNQLLEDGIDAAAVPPTWFRPGVEWAAQVVARMRQTIRRIKVTAESVRNVKQSTDGVYRAVGAGLSELSTNAAEMADALGLPAPWVAQTDEAGQQIKAARWQADTARTARRVRHAAALERRNYRPESDVLAIYEAVEGDTIWSVAGRWYGDPSRGPDIARRNNLISAHLRPGQRIVIPSLPRAA